jgi:Rrf2 family protein
LISRTGIHAVRALARLSELADGEYAGAATLAGEIGAPANYLGKLLKTLLRPGLVESRKGAGGGFRLARDPRELTLLDVLDETDDVRRWNGCFLGRESCSDAEPCAMHEEWSRVKDAYIEFVSRTTVADVAAREDALSRAPAAQAPPGREER